MSRVAVQALLKEVEDIEQLTRVTDQALLLGKDPVVANLYPEIPWQLKKEERLSPEGVLAFSKGDSYHALPERIVYYEDHFWDGARAQVTFLYQQAHQIDENLTLLPFVRYQSESPHHRVESYTHGLLVQYASEQFELFLTPDVGLTKGGRNAFLRTARFREGRRFAAFHLHHSFSPVERISSRIPRFSDWTHPHLLLLTSTQQEENPSPLYPEKEVYLPGVGLIHAVSEKVTRTIIGIRARR